MLYNLFLVGLCGAAAFVLVRDQTSPRPAGLRGRIRAGGWGLVLLPVAVMAAAMAGGARPLAAVEPAIAVILLLGTPRLAAKLAPYAVLGLAIEGLILAKNYHTGFSGRVMYGLVLTGDDSFALGTRLVITLVPDEGSREAGELAPPDVPASLVRLGRTVRFRQAVTSMASAIGLDADELSARLVTAMAALAHAMGRDFAEPDWWRLLDALVLIAAHPAAP